MFSPTISPAAPRGALRRRARLLGLGLLLALGGCKLIDQTTFAPAPGTRPAVPAAATAAVKPPPVDPRTPLVTIGAGTAPEDYRALLRFAVGAAERRDREVRFDVMAVAPAAAAGHAAANGTAAGAAPGPSDAEPPALRASVATATAVMHEIAAAGVPADRIRLHAALAADAARGEVRVYVR